MKIFVTGATGFIATAVVAELLASDHEVIGLTRSEPGAERLVSVGAQFIRADLTDVAAVAAAADRADGVIHLGFRHDAPLADAVATDRAVIEAIGAALTGSQRPFVVTSGTLVLTVGRVGVETDSADSSAPAGVRGANEGPALALADRGVRVSVVRLAPSVHDAVRRGFVGALIDGARRVGHADYLGSGAQRWPTVHRRDAATLYRLAVESAAAGSVLHGVGEDGVSQRSIAEVIAARLDVPVGPVAPAEASERFGWLVGLVDIDAPASSELTQESLVVAAVRLRTTGRSSCRSLLRSGIVSTAVSRARPAAESERLLRPSDLAVLAVGTFTLGIDGFVLAGLLPQVAASLHVSPSTAGQLTTLFALVYAVGSPIIAAVAGGWDRRVLLAAGMAVFCGGVVVQALGSDFVAVAAGRVLAALGAAAFQATAYAVAGTLSDDEHRPRALAVVAGGSSVALVAGLPFGILVGQQLGWRAAMWVLLGLGGLSLISVSRLPSSYATPLRLRLRQRVAALGDHRVLQVLAGTLATLLPVFIVLGFVPAILDETGWPVVLATLAYGAGQVIGTVAAPRLVGRSSARATSIAGALGVTTAAAVLCATRTIDPAAVATLAVLGCAAGLLVVPQQARLFLVTPSLAPVAVGLNGSAIYLASAGGAAIGGVVLSVGGALGPAVAAAILGALGTAIAVLVRPERSSKTMISNREGTSAS